MENLVPILGPLITVILAAIGFYAAFVKLSGEVKVQMNDMKDSINEIKHDVGELKNSVNRQGQDIVRLDERFTHLGEKVEKHNNVVERTAILESQMDTCWQRYDDSARRITRLENAKIGE